MSSDPAPAADLGRIGDALDRAAVLDRIAEPVHDRLSRVLDGTTAAAAARGEWLGHPLHPMLTDLPIGFWTSAWLIDLFGGPDLEPVATTFVGLGVLSAVPTALSGWADWVRLPHDERRTGVVHATANGIAVGLYAASWRARRSGDTARGVRLGHAGAAVATAGAFLGGHLAFPRR